MADGARLTDRNCRMASVSYSLCALWEGQKATAKEGRTSPARKALDQVVRCIVVI